ncbi:MAG TPA: hypothetical protein PKA28_19715 [Methylomusa anaerophila]|uniref:Uncharacterized protein n=1 Tax=Methylomusa anaerophila TaxID=1930071 RepID=A0A348AIH1_9FIRM|nr:hypothetical protein [Methylomusa anaerophila]BBB90869.1 hypothetical protein MAMMFC1_01536 [Methylomusa anaerophila]HML90662.1 hypothetical protein [Methylomusa anaerophila]
MNKIKLLYDVVKTMKDKEVFNGAVKVEVQKDQTKIFFLQNEFEKNLVTGQTKAKISTDLDYEGKKVKHESNTEFTRQYPAESRRHEFMKHMLRHHAANSGGIKRKLNKLAFAFSILNSMQAEEQDDKTIIISLQARDLPEEMKALIREKISHADTTCHHHGDHVFMKEFCSMENHNFTFNMFINKNYEVEKIIMDFDGNQKDDQNEQHKFKAMAELSFAW